MNKKLGLIALLAGCLALPASAQVVKTSAGKVITSSGNPVTVGPASYVGPVANATILPNTLSSSASFTMMTRKAHYNRSQSTRFKFCLPNWRVDTADANYIGAEVGTGNDIQVKHWIEYPVGTYTQTTFSGSTALATITDLTTLCSDFNSVAIPTGAVFYEWVYVVPTGGNNFPYYNSTLVQNPLYFQNGGTEKAIRSSSGVPTAPPSAFTESNSGRSGYWSAAILGDTTQPTFCIIGDSRATGAQNIADNTYDLGDIARSVGQTSAYVNLSVGGRRMASYSYNSALEQALITTSGCTNIINQLGINEFNQQPTTTTQWQAIWQNLVAKFNGKKFVAVTMEPLSTSTDSWATTANQTANTNITTVNDFVRASGVPYLELSDATSSAHNSGKWKVNGSNLYFTVDGLHATNQGDFQILNARAVNPRAIDLNTPISASYPSINMSGTVSSYVTGQFSQGALTNSALGLVALGGIVPASPPMTWETWFNCSAIPGVNTTIGQASEGFALQATTGNAGVHTASGSFVFGTTAFTTNTWHHVAFTVNQPAIGTQATETIYLDGVSVATTTRNISAIQWGNFQGFNMGTATCAVDELAEWTGVKYTGSFTPPTSAYTGSESGLIGLWHFDGNLNGTRGPASQ